MVCRFRLPRNKAPDLVVGIYLTVVFMGFFATKLRNMMSDEFLDGFITMQKSYQMLKKEISKLLNSDIVIIPIKFLKFFKNTFCLIPQT